MKHESLTWDSVELLDISKLTSMSHGAGCGCKVSPDVLKELLAVLPPNIDPKVLVHSASSDDAAVYRINDELAIIATLDFFTPLVDDPYVFGQIAVTNALNDIYAMGGLPLFGMNIVCYPTRTHRLEPLKAILQGGADQASKAKISVVGGHSIDDPEVKFGMAVVGIAKPSEIIRNSGCKIGDQLVLTKPIGTGLVSTAIKRGLADREQAEEAIHWMTTLGDTACLIMRETGVNACTDVTGFGLLGHLSEMCEASQTGAVIWPDKVPILSSALRLIESGCASSGTFRNIDAMQGKAIFENDSIHLPLLLCDPQSAGGMLISVSSNKSAQLLSKLRLAGLCASIIGEVAVRSAAPIKISAFSE